MAGIAELDWRFIPETSGWGPLQMALEEVAAETAVADGVGLVRVFRWEPSTLSLGYGQDPDTVDWSFCRDHGVDVTRRQTGGGGIYHDHDGDVSYSIVVPAEAVPGELLECYHLLCTPLVSCLRDLGLDAAFADRERPAIYPPACFLREIHPAHDVVVDGRKISGNAQYRQRDAVIQHGSVIVSNAPRRHLGVFADHRVDRAAFRRRVTAVDEHVDRDRPAVVDRLEAALTSWSGATEGSWREDELAAARDLAEEKYAAEGWVRRRTTPSG